MSGAKRHPLETSNGIRFTLEEQAALTDQERYVVTRLYFHQIPASQIARALQVSGKRVAQVRDRALAKLWLREKQTACDKK